MEMSYKSCAICHNVKTPICNHCVLFDKFEKSEWAKDFESEIRANERIHCANILVDELYSESYYKESYRDDFLKMFNKKE